jgi:PKD repeat protein
MGRTFLIRRLTAAVAASLLAASCTTHKQETPSLTGPSGLATSVVITVSPDVLTQDGASQSLVQIQAYDNNGQPLRNKSLRVDITVDGFITDFGRLSAKSVVTDNNGRASVTYTAPAPIQGISSTVNVDIAVTPSESDFANATSRFVTIRLVPSGVLPPPVSPFTPDFAPPTATIGNPATFTASSTGTSSTSQVATFVWDFGDGETAVGQTVTHTFDEAGTFLVTVALVDTLGRTSFVTKSVTVGQGALPTADIIASPSTPAVGQTVNFSGSGSTAEPGHRVVNFTWNFGDGTVGSGEFVQHAFTSAGTFTVTLRVTDDVGRTSTLKQATVLVGGGGPGGGGTAQANITMTPTAPTVGQTVTFDGTGSTASSGGTIVSYTWTFSTGGTATGQQTSRAFSTAGSVTATLTVTDSQGKTGTATRTFTVAP